MIAIGDKFNDYVIVGGSTERDWEYQRDKKERVVVAGKIHKKVDFWHTILQASQFVMAVIIHGYSLPFIQHCPSFYAKNNASSRRNYDFVTEAIEDLLATNCIVEMETRPHCCNPLTVSEGEKLRLVLDLRHVNKYLETRSFRYENIDTVRKMFRQGYYFCVFDLKSGYHHISVNPQHYKYLGFSWTYKSGIIRYFVFVVVPFGLATASYLFTKLVRPLVKKWRGAGIRCVVYLDDGIFGSQWRGSTSRQACIIETDLKEAGFTINEEKSILVPVQTAVWLGFLINTIDYTFSVPQGKIERLITSITKVMRHKYGSARDIAKIAGSIISMGPGIGQLTRLFTRKMYSFIDESSMWDEKRVFNGGIINELNFWAKNLNVVNGYSIKNNHAITKVVYTDASDYAYGGYIVQRCGNQIAHGSFQQDEREKSFASELVHHTVLWHSDNTNVARIISNGSSKDELQELALDIFETSMKYDIKIIPKWIPREENQIADSISKYHDTDDWGIDGETFQYLQQQFGNFTIDRFADSDNRKVYRFDARFFCPGVENVNTFTSEWGNEFSWLCPPIGMIGDTLQHAKICKCRAVLLIPEWKSAYFWPLLTPNGEKFYPYVVDYRVLDPYYINGCRNDSVFTGFTNFRSLALLLNFQD